MSFKKLQIKLLSNSGELLRAVNCFAGQVTVLRGNSAADLQPFQRVLAGVPGPERMTITVDRNDFEPSHAHLVGFGESFSDSTQTVAEYLEKFGLPRNALEATLLSYGLSETGHLPCSQLSSDQARRLRIVAGTFDSEKILVLNNPFEDISSQWRERFAENIVNTARNRNQIVVVPSLTYRPEAWIDNEYIARIQVGENNQRTIGFGSGGSEMNDLVKQMRSMMKDESSAEEALDASPPKPASSSFKMPSPPKPAVSTPRRTGGGSLQSKDAHASSERIIHVPLEETVQVSEEEIAKFVTPQPRSIRAWTGSLLPMLADPKAVGGLLVLLLALIYVSGGSEANQNSLEASAATQESTEANISEKIPEANSDVPPADVPVIKGETAQDLTPPTVQAPMQLPNTNSGGSVTNPFASMFGGGNNNAGGSTTLLDPSKLAANQNPAKTVFGKNPSGVQLALDTYSSEIKTAIMGAFEGNYPEGNVDTPPPKTERKGSSDLFSLLESTSGSGENIKSTSPPALFGQPPTDTGASSPPSFFSGSSNYDPNENPEERRERIRQKFLEAIERAAARRKEQGE